MDLKNPYIGGDRFGSLFSNDRSREWHLEECKNLLALVELLGWCDFVWVEVGIHGSVPYLLFTWDGDVVRRLYEFDGHMIQTEGWDPRSHIVVDGITVESVGMGNWLFNM